MQQKYMMDINYDSNAAVQSNQLSGSMATPIIYEAAALGSKAAPIEFRRLLDPQPTLRNVTATITFSTPLIQPSPPLHLCYKFGTEPYTLVQSLYITVREPVVVSISPQLLIAGRNTAITSVGSFDLGSLPDRLFWTAFGRSCQDPAVENATDVVLTRPNPARTTLFAAEWGAMTRHLTAFGEAHFPSFSTVKAAALLANATAASVTAKVQATTPTPRHEPLQLCWVFDSLRVVHAPVLTMTVHTITGIMLWETAAQQGRSGHSTNPRLQVHFIGTGITNRDKAKWVKPIALKDADVACRQPAAAGSKAQVCIRAGAQPAYRQREDRCDHWIT